MSDLGAHADRAHSRIGPSSSERIWHCPASVLMADRYGTVSDPGPAALAGTRAHELMEIGLLKKGIVDGHDDMAEAAREIIAVVEGEIEESGKDHILLVEQRVDLTRHHPELFGSLDVGLYDPKRRKLFIFDLKTGRFTVEADSLQLVLYAAMALEYLGDRAAKVEVVETIIVQPYAQHPDGPVRRARHTKAAIIHTAAEYVSRAWTATGANEMPEAVAGKWCRYCPARAQCVAYRTEQTRRAGIEFGVDGSVTAPLPDVNEIPAEQLGKMLTAAAMMKPWIAAVEARALVLMENLHVQVPGWYLREKRATRKWIDPERAEKRLRAMGVPSEQLYERKFVSPAQAEKLLRAVDRPSLTDLIIAEIGGVALAPQPYNRDSADMETPEN